MKIKINVKEYCYSAQGAGRWNCMCGGKKCVRQWKSITWVVIILLLVRASAYVTIRNYKINLYVILSQRHAFRNVIPPSQVAYSRDICLCSENKVTISSSSIQKIPINSSGTYRRLKLPSRMLKFGIKDPRRYVPVADNILIPQSYSINNSDFARLRRWFR